ncbi:hypothetical protein SF1_32410 [Sphingobacterium faecium NBRC 15299]|nr:hypothetical protein SF1_32410 [Sphingobacterium faecium NBRC 15299]
MQLNTRFKIAYRTNSNGNHYQSHKNELQGMKKLNYKSHVNTISAIKEYLFTNNTTYFKIIYKIYNILMILFIY